MLFFRNRLVFGIIKKVISNIFKAFYAIVKVLNLQIFLLVLVLGGIVYLTGGFNGSEFLKWAFYVLIGLSLVYALIETFRKLFGLDKKKVKEKPKKTVEEKNEQNIKQEKKDEVKEKEQPNEKEQEPKYYRVKENNNLIMAEYSDRVELFRIENGQMIKIRTDYK